MSFSRRTAYTLVEILVVISIIGVMASLILPAVNAAREAGRRVQCINNQKQLALASQGYEGKTNEGRLVGYHNLLNVRTTTPATPVMVSWPVPLFPHMEQQVIYDSWRDSLSPQVTYLPALVCPSDYTKNVKTPGSLTYVINAGMADNVTFENVANGVAHNYFSTDAAYLTFPPSPYGVATTSGDFYDGRASTLLFAENVQATQWDTLVNGGSYKQNTVFVWWDAVGANLDRQINVNRKAPGLNSDRARPSSFHAGGIVIVAFADGHTGRLREQIDYSVYQRLMAPHDARSNLPAAVIGLGPPSVTTYE